MQSTFTRRTGVAWLVAAGLSALCAACSGGGSSSAGSGVGPSPTAATGTIEPSDGDWAQLAAQFTSIAVDAVQQALSSSVATAATTTSSVAPRAVTGLPSTALNWSTQYFCCGSQANGASSVVRTGGGLVVAADGSNTMIVTETIEASSTLWTFGTQSNAFQVQIPPGGLTVTASLVTSGGQIQGVQQFRLAGSVAYAGANGVQKTGAVDLVVGYTSFPNQSSANQPPTGNGRFGTIQFVGSTLPSRVAPTLVVAPTITQGPPSPITYSGPFSAPLVVTIISGLTGPAAPTSCTQVSSLNGIATFILQRASSGELTGSGQLRGTESFTATCSPGVGPSSPISWNQPISGSAGAFTFSGQTAATGGGVTVTNSVSFSGTLSGSVVSGTVNYDRSEASPNVSAHGSTTFAVTAR